MKFLLDVNVGSTIAHALTKLGHNVIRMALVDPTALDLDILERAVSEGRIIITYDSDFSELVYRYGGLQPPAIIYIRFEPENISDVLPRLLPLLDLAVLERHMTVIGPETIRRRPFPVI